MVSIRRSMALQATLDQLGLHYGILTSGEVEIKEAITAEQREQLKSTLLTVGLELLEDKKAILIEKIKNLIGEMVYQADQPLKLKNSDYISEQLDYDYTYLANVFSQMTGTTIEQYTIAQRIERVKQLLLWDKRSLSQIAYDLNYSSIGHLSNQFKKVTGVTPTFLKQLKYLHEQVQADEVLFFDHLSELFAWSLSGPQRHYYHQLLRRGWSLVVTTLMNTILWASRSFVTLTGYNPLDVLGKTPHFLQGPRTDAPTLKFIHEQLQGAQAVETELVKYRSSGEPCLCHVQIEPMRTGQGELTHFLAVGYEVNEKREG